MVTANAPVGLPPKRDYINFSSDSALMSLIGSGKWLIQELSQLTWTCRSRASGIYIESVFLFFVCSQTLWSMRQWLRRSISLSGRRSACSQSPTSVSTTFTRRRSSVASRSSRSEASQRRCRQVAAPQSSRSTCPPLTTTDSAQRSKFCHLPLLHTLPLNCVIPGTR